MAKSQVITVIEGTNGAVTVAAKDAELTDLVTTIISPDKALTGGYKLIQDALKFVGGMSLQSYLKSGSFNFIKG